MSNSEENRLDRLESLAETTLTELREIKSGLQEIKLGLQETNQGLKETRAIANSNAKSIEALTNSLAESKKEWEKDRRGLDQLLGQLTRSMSDFYEVQSYFYNRFDNEEKQYRMVEILDRYFPPRKSCQFLAGFTIALLGFTG
jgi:uncharacterized phage infection (PIP) family protein YhgE